MAELPATQEKLGSPLAVPVPEAARLIGISRAQMWVHVKSGLIPSVKIGGRRIVPVEQLREWLAKQSQATGAR